MNIYKKIIIAVGAVIIFGIAYYTISPIFRHVVVDEVAPQVEIKLSPGVINKPSTKPVEASASIVQEKSSPVVGTAFHPASGNVRVLNTKDGTVIRYENFKTLNGPDLYVYLSNDLDAKDFVNLGLMKATEGNVNYTVPEGVDVTKYKYVLVWCKIFGVLFNSAEIN